MIGSPLALVSGTRLGACEVIAPIGAGGIGDVYRARDTRLDRTVAIKVLPEESAADAEFRIQYAPSADGQRFLLNQTPTQTAQSPITVTVNWLARLKK